MNWRWVTALVATLCALTGCATTTTVPAPPRGGSVLVGPQLAVDLLGELPVRDRDPLGYTRDSFGQAWADTDRNSCDTRNDVLRRDLVDEVLKSNTNGCVVLKGTLHDPYTNRTIDFERGDGEVEIDHIVSLADAYRSGARSWDQPRRERFANSPGNLIATSTATNRDKGDDTADEWQPPNEAFRCRWAGIYVAVKRSNWLSVHELEKQALYDVLSRCPGELALVMGG
jgi:hypothetical protein